MFKKYSVLVTTSLVMSMVSLPVKAANASFSEMITFGNSISDTGNVFNLTGGTFPPSPLYNEGRFSDGSIWIEHVSEDLGLNPRNFYGNDITDIGEGLNFAIGGATSGTTTLGDTPEFSFPGVTTQVNNFISLLNGSRINEDALITLWVGENDYVENFQDNGTILDPTIPVSNISNLVAQLADAGAKNILVSNLINLGDAPLASDLFPANQLDGLNQLTAAHNNLLNGAINGLNTSLPETNLAILDVNSIIANIANDPAAFGFDFDNTQSCLSPNSFPNIDPNVVRCDDPSQYIYFDNQHYTSAVHKLIANDAMQTINENFASNHDNGTTVPESGNTIALIVLGLGFLSRFPKKALNS